MSRAMNQPAPPLHGQRLRCHRLFPLLLASAILFIAWSTFKLGDKISDEDGDFKVHEDGQTKKQSNRTIFYSSELPLKNHTITATTNASGFTYNNQSFSGKRTQIKTGQDDPENAITTTTSVAELYHELKALSDEDLLKRMNQVSQEELDEVAKYHKQVNAKNPKPSRVSLMGHLGPKSGFPTPNDPMFETTRNMLKQLSKEELFNRFNFNQPSMRENVQAQYCEHSTNENATNDSSCYKLLSPHVKGKRAWFFFGDSQMWRMMRHFVYPYHITSTQIAANHRCGFLDYCYLEKSNTWIPPFSPNQTLGPAEFGMENPFCSDLSGSMNARWESYVPNGTHFVEHLIVEFASDVEQQSLYTNTTQEAATIHAANQLQLRNLTNDDSVCVVNTGLHDQILCIGKSDEYCLEIYLNNVNSYLNLLQYVCGNIVWVSTTTVRGDLGRPQRNDLTFQWNQRVNATIMRKYPNAFFLDVWNVSSHSHHIDNVHHTDVYYGPLRNLFTSMM